MNIKDKVVLITGASRGIGSALAKAFASQGAHLILAARASIDESIKSELQNMGAASVQSYEVDLSDENSIRSFVNKLSESQVSVDILINNAGQLTGGLLETQDLTDIRQMLRVNLEAVVSLTHHLLPSMLLKKSGKIVNNSSVSGKMFFPCASTYAASKAGVVAFTESLRQELNGTGVTTLLLITPGIKTKMYDDIEKLYGKNLDLKFLSHITAEEWAANVVEAVKDDRPILWPKGMNRFGVFMGHHFPDIFSKFVSNSFKR